MTSGLRSFFSSVWGWLVIALLTSLVGLVFLSGQERHRTDLGLTVWTGQNASH